MLMPTDQEHLSIPDLRPQHRRAAEATVAVARQATPADLARPTPCGDWTLADLLVHMTVQNHGFAASAEGRGGDLAIWQAGPPGADPVADYAAATNHVLAAFASEGVLDRPFLLPEFTTQPFPAAQAISFHFIDCVVHGWDVAQSLGVPYVLDADVLRAALPVAEAVPDGEVRTRPGAAFGPAVPTEPADDPLDRILRLLGRSPDWAQRLDSDAALGGSARTS